MTKTDHKRSGRGRGVTLPSDARDALLAKCRASTAEAVAQELGLSTRTVLRAAAGLGVRSGNAALLALSVASEASRG